MRTTRFITATALAFALTATPALAEGPPLEEGATFFENNTCVEADGATGFAAGDGQCITTADYDEMYSVENLSTVPSSTSKTGQSIAEEAGLVAADDGGAASDRQLGEGLVEETASFRELLERIFSFVPFWTFTLGGGVW